MVCCNTEQNIKTQQNKNTRKFALMITRGIVFRRSPIVQRCKRLSTTLRSLDNVEAKSQLTYTISQTEQRPVAFWLLGMSGLIFGMVSVGGITRLTRSGLSMTDWKLQGSLPPLNKEQWNLEFERLVYDDQIQFI